MMATAQDVWRSGLVLYTAGAIYIAAELVAWVRRQR